MKNANWSAVAKMVAPELLDEPTQYSLGEMCWWR